MITSIVPWRRIGGFGPWVVSLFRAAGVRPAQLWAFGALPRAGFLSLARIWGILPRAIRRKSPFQIIDFFSVRSYQGVPTADGYRALWGVFRRSALFCAAWGEVKIFERRFGRARYAAILPHPDQASLPPEFLARIRSMPVVSGGADATFPYQLDRRHASRTGDEVEQIGNQIRKAGCPRWYAENLTSYDPIFSPLPGGMSPSPWRGSVGFVRTRPRRNPSDKLALCAHREGAGRRAGPQFDERRAVSELARGEWEEFAYLPQASVSLNHFRSLLRKHAFTLCVEGGGIDPSPKAFEALRQGSIPVIKESPTADAYRHFPVLVVPSWDVESLDRARLISEEQRIRTEWTEWFDVLERMTFTYWANLIQSQTDTRLR